MKTKFDLEQDIMGCWNICEDIDTVIDAVMERSATPDNVANILQGMRELYHYKFEKTFETCEEVIKQ